jgi:BON domain
MDHRWDESTRQDRAAREERERYGTSRIERDPDVERRDELCLADRLHLRNQSPWAIGTAWYDQRDTYTRNAEIDERGYAYGPSIHPEEGSYAYPRAAHPGVISVTASHASLYEKEAWPWLVYKEPEADPYFSYLRESEKLGLWQRLKGRLASTFLARRRSKKVIRPDERIRQDVSGALIGRDDLDASDIEVSVKAGEVTLEGTVSDRRSKRVAEHVVEGVSGVHAVHNRLTIRHDEPSDTFAVAVMGT